jgi:ribosomal protein L11 methyltransferase
LTAVGQDKQWHSLNVDVEPSAREAVEYALMEAGALGTVTNDPSDGLMRIVGYFETIPDREQIRSELLEALRIYNLPTSSVRDMNVEQFANRDWLDEWKKNWQPAVVGRFVIAPPWSEITDRPDQIVIRIEPGMAFGTGTHETTRLCLAAIEKHFRGDSLLDVGTGTGILAIAAAKLFPEARIVACDIDEDALAIAQDNARANDVAEQIEFRAGSIDDSMSSADFVCANLTADVILQTLSILLNLTCGKLVLSGILETQLASVVDRLHEAGVSDIEVTQDGEWVCCVVY